MKHGWWGLEVVCTLCVCFSIHKMPQLLIFIQLYYWIYGDRDSGAPLGNDLTLNLNFPVSFCPCRHWRQDSACWSTEDLSRQSTTERWVKTSNKVSCRLLTLKKYHQEFCSLHQCPYRHQDHHRRSWKVNLTMDRGCQRNKKWRCWSIIRWL